MSEFQAASLFPEPDLEDRALAFQLRQKYVAFLAVGFTDAQAMELISALISTVRSSA